MRKNPQALWKRVAALYAFQVGSARIQHLLHVCYSVPVYVIDTSLAFSLRHPNLCVANLLGEVCPIFQKFSDFFLFVGGRLLGSSLCAFMGPGGSVEMR